MSDELIAAIIFCVCGILYLACGSLVAALLGITSGFAWYACVILWPAVLAFLLVLLQVLISLAGAFIRAVCP